MTAHPNFIDNREGNTLRRALGAALGFGAGAVVEESSGEPPDLVRIATAFFNPTGFAQIAGYLRSVPAVRLLLGADLSATAAGERRRLDETAAAFERRRIRTRLQGLDEALHRERDALPFNRTSAAALRTLSAALRGGNMEVRRYEKAFLHAKAYVFTAEDGAYGKADGIIAGSSNLTGAGLTRNLELNLGRYDRPTVEQASRWFDELWDEAEPYDLSAVFEAALRPRTPWEIFIRVLWQLYGGEVEEDAANDQNLPLTSFQKHGAARALRLIRDTGGAVVADEVGLGKTFIAGELLQIYRARRQRALLVCPAALRDTTWRKFWRGSSCSSSASPTNSSPTRASWTPRSSRARSGNTCSGPSTNTSSSSSTRRTTTATPTRRRAPACCAGCCSVSAGTCCSSPPRRSTIHCGISTI